MVTCVRSGCTDQVLAPWWLLCQTCTLPLLDPPTPPSPANQDQQQTAGWDAVEWAERIAPHR